MESGRGDVNRIFVSAHETKGIKENEVVIVLLVICLFPVWSVFLLIVSLAFPIAPLTFLNSLSPSLFRFEVYFSVLQCTRHRPFFALQTYLNVTCNTSMRILIFSYINNGHVQCLSVLHKRVYCEEN